MNKTEFALDIVIAVIRELKAENKQWETNYNNLSAEFKEVSAIAQAKSEEVEKIKKDVKKLIEHIAHDGGK